MLNKNDYPHVPGNGLKGHQAHSPGQRPGKLVHEVTPCKGKSVEYQCFCPCRATLEMILFPGRCPGLSAYWPFRPL